jgi:hypothetical protein
MRLVGGTDRATEGGLLGGAFEEARDTGGSLAGDAGVALSTRCFR